MKKNRVTMQDVAKRLGITKMTVSRFLNKPSSVAAATATKIQNAVNELGFVPSRVPAMLAQDSSKALGVVIPSFSNMVFADMIQGIEDAARAQDFSVLIAHSGYSQPLEERLIADLLSYQVDGLILTEPEHSELTCRRIKAMAVPCVETMSIPSAPLQHAIGLNHRSVMRHCTKALLDSGRLQPVYFGVRLDIRTMQRQQGYEDAMREYGLTPCVLDSEERSNFTLASKLMQECLIRYPHADAILTTNDDIAVGAMLACQSRGIKIPDDIAILGYNGLNIGSATIPMLCSIGTPRYEIGRQAVALLLQNLQEHDMPSQNIILPYSITAGHSVTPAELQNLQQSAQLYAKSLANPTK